MNLKKTTFHNSNKKKKRRNYGVHLVVHTSNNPTLGSQNSIAFLAPITIWDVIFHLFQNPDRG